MEKKVINVLNYYEILVVDTEYLNFLLFFCNTFFYCCKQFTAITGHNKQMSVALVTRVQKCEWRLLSHNSWNVFLIFYVQWLLLSTTRPILDMTKCFFQTYTTDILHFSRSFFIAMHVELKILVKTYVLFYFYNETRSNHQKCSIKPVLKNFAIFTRKRLCWSLFLVKLQAFRPAILLKRNSSTTVFLWILQNI